MLDSALEGYNSCLFAYGQTGSGKTYTLFGHENDRGIIYRLADELFSTIEAKQSETMTFQVSLSMLEIYHEKVNDLLIPYRTRTHGGLRIKETKQREVYVDGLTAVQISS